MNTQKLEQVPIDKLVPYSRNARTHRLYMDSPCSHHAEIQYLYLIYNVYIVIILPFHSCKKKRAPFTALFHIDFLIHLSYSTVLQPMSLNFFPKMG